MSTDPLAGLDDLDRDALADIALAGLDKPPPGRFVIVYPSGKVDSEVFDCEEAAAAAGEEAFDEFEVAELIRVAGYRVQYLPTHVRGA